MLPATDRAPSDPYRDCDPADEPVAYDATGLDPAAVVYRGAVPDGGPLSDPLLGHFLGRTREDLLAIQGMTPAGAAAILEARAGGALDHWGDVERTLRTARAADPGAVMKEIYRIEAAEFVKERGLAPGGSVLFLASTPKDSAPLDAMLERDSIRAPLRNVTAIEDPTLGEIEALARTGAFKGVWVSGHGDRGQLLLCDDDDKGVRVSAEDFARAVSASPEVQFVMASACSSAAKPDEGESVVQAIALHGPSAAGFAMPVTDAAATAVSAAVAHALARGVPFGQAVATAYRVLFPNDAPAPAATTGVLAWPPFVQFERGKGVHLERAYPGTVEQVRLAD